VLALFYLGVLSPRLLNLAAETVASIF